MKKKNKEFQPQRPVLRELGQYRSQQKPMASLGLKHKNRQSSHFQNPTMVVFVVYLGHCARTVKYLCSLEGDKASMAS